MAEELFLADDDATALLGALLARALKPGELVLLEGDLGAGKTALARAIIRTLMADPDLDVPSPSFALVQPYEGGATSVMHADLYRLVAARDVDELGLFDNPRSIVLVEWPERVPELGERRDAVVRLDIAAGGSGRTARVHFSDERSF